MAKIAKPLKTKNGNGLHIKSPSKFICGDIIEPMQPKLDKNKRAKLRTEVE